MVALDLDLEFFKRVLIKTDLFRKIKDHVHFSAHTIWSFVVSLHLKGELETKTSQKMCCSVKDNPQSLKA